jgi:protein-L-isoaspartate(D-aspartate) O-methyltransferase
VTTDTDQTRRLRAALVRALVEGGRLPSPEWQRAFARVPRHLFVPSFYRDRFPFGELIDGTRPEHYDDWLAAVYSDEVLFIQRHEEDQLVCSSSSMPSIMAQMLDALRVSPGNRVLEIGTGSGYNAALLCERLGSDHVTTVDIDAGLADAARERLRLAGYTPAVAVADGFHGYAANAPYDRVISTCRILQVPSAWIDQTCPGGLVLAMLPQGMAQLTVRADGSAGGRFHPTAFAFMYMREHWPPRPSVSALIEVASGDGSTRPAADADDPLIEEPADTAIGMLLRLVVWVDLESVKVRPTHRLYVDRVDYSWALLDYEEAEITQGGPRRIWDAAVELHGEWCALGRPGRDRFGLTVTTDRRQYVWLDHPTEGRRWDLAGGGEGTWWTSPPPAVTTHDIPTG